MFGLFTSRLSRFQRPKGRLLSEATKMASEQPAGHMQQCLNPEIASLTLETHDQNF